MHICAGASPFLGNACPAQSARRRLRRALLAATAIALASCGGSEVGGGGSGGGGGGGGGGVTGTYYLVGGAGSNAGFSGTIAFGPSNNVSANALTLQAADPNGMLNSTVAAMGDWLDEATVSQWTVASGIATQLGNRYHVFALTDGHLHVTDLAVGSSTAPVTSNLSTVLTSAICPSMPTVLNDFANPASSLLVFRVPGITGAADCGTADDLFTVVPLSAGPATAPGTANYNEPVDAVHDSTGAMTAILLIEHPTQYDASGNPTAQSTVAYATPGALATPIVIGGTNGTNGLNGTGLNGSDFQSLAVVPQANGSTVWLYRDVNNIVAVNLSAIGTLYTVFSAQDTDIIQGPAVVSGTTAYVAMSDSTSGTNEIVAINTASLSNQEGVVVVTETATQVQIVGIAGGTIYYTLSYGAYLHTVPTSGVGLTSGTSVFAGSATVLLDTSIAPVVVAGGVYYTVKSSTTSPYYQAYFYNGTTSSALGTGGSGSQVLGGVLSAALPTTGSTSSYAGAVLAFLASTDPTSLYPGAAISSYDGNGALIASHGSLPILSVNADYSSVLLSPGLLQAGMPTLLQVSGTTSAGNPAADLFEFAPGASSALVQTTNTIQ